MQSWLTPNQQALRSPRLLMALFVPIQSLLETTLMPMLPKGTTGKAWGFLSRQRTGRGGFRSVWGITDCTDFIDPEVDLRFTCCAWAVSDELPLPGEPVVSTFL